MMDEPAQAGGLPARTRAVVDRYLSVVDARREDIVKFCRDIIAIPSVTGDEARLQEFLARRLEGLGFRVDQWEPDPQDLPPIPVLSGEVCFRNRPNVVGVMPGSGGGKSLLLNSHVDVITPEPTVEWRHDPWKGEVTEGRIYGRGAADMKGGLTASIMGVACVKEAGILLAGDVLAELVVGEEDGPHATLSSVRRGYRSDGALFMEPSSCAVQPAHRGAAFWQIAVEGCGAHGGTAYLGVSAAEKGVKVFGAIRSFQEQRERRLGRTHLLYSAFPEATSMCVGEFHAGDFLSSVPERCVMRGSVELLPGDSVDRLKSDFARTVEQCARDDEWLSEHPPLLSWIGPAYDGVETPVDHPFIQTLISAHRVVNGAEPEVSGAQFGCDMRVRVTELKTPSAVFGPGSPRNAHAVDEFVTIDELVLATKVVGVLAIMWCAQGGPMR